MSSAIIPTLPTVGEIARRTGKPCTAWITSSARGELSRSGVPGHAKIYAESDVAFIASELRRIDEEREGGNG